jgi:tol-pal system protein YbgF
MKRHTLINRTGLLLFAGALFSFHAAPARAQYNDSGQLINRLNQLENQVQTLGRAVYRGEAPPPGAVDGGASSAAAANYEARMSAIEDAQRKLTGDIEKVSFDLQQIKDKVERMQADSQQRFQQLESGAAAAPAAQAPASNSVVAPPSAPASGTLSAGGTAEVLYEEGFADVRESRFGAGEAKFKQFLAQYPNHPLAANAQYWLGETYYVRGNFKEAARSFAQGYQSYPKSAKAEDSLYKLSLSLAKLGKTDDACLSLRQMQKDFPASTGPLHAKAQEQLKQLNCP